MKMYGAPEECRVLECGVLTTLDGVEIRDSKETLLASCLHFEIGNEERGMALNCGIVELPATVGFVDIAGLVKGASKREGPGNQFPL
ncbi:MAG: hypothetical protein LBD78_06355 [Spirochaetaceae bacterium]|nr:hypothetical protein [Spirochaetaceae bacterium]